MQPRLTYVSVPQSHGAFNVPGFEIRATSVLLVVIIFLIAGKKPPTQISRNHSLLVLLR
jgi:hypothetical protein